MLSVDDLNRVHTAVCHRNGEARPCPDGTASAILVHDALPKARIAFASHEELRDFPIEEGLLFCDVTPPESWMIRAGEARARPILLDHHETARRVVEMSPLGVFASHPSQSGATLAYRHVWRPIMEMMGRSVFDHHDRGERARRFALLASVRDTFQKSSEDWEAACFQAEALALHEWEDFAEIGDPFGDGDGGGFGRLTAMLGAGRPLFRKRMAVAAQAWRGAIKVETHAGTKLGIVNTLDTSDVEEHAAKEGSVVVGFQLVASASSEHDRPIMRLSLRSSFHDVGAFCQWLGGGGHRAAAGASVDAEGDPVEQIVALFEGHRRHVEYCDGLAAGEVPF